MQEVIIVDILNTKIRQTTLSIQSFEDITLVPH